jgi:arabinofuranosyltransferase
MSPTASVLRNPFANSMKTVVSFLTRMYHRYFTALFFSLVVILLLYASYNRFMEDDAFISFRYAENFVHGNGLVWNKGEYVEGYTNFLWTMLIGACIFLGWNAAISSQVLGMGFFIVSLLVMYFLLKMIFRSRNVALLGMVVLGSNYTFSAFATSGLETQMQTSLILIATYFWMKFFFFKPGRSYNLVLSSFFMAAAVLTRPDSALIVGVLLITGILPLIRSATRSDGAVIKLLSLTVPVAVIVGIWIAWKWWYYGDILPNTYYSKIASPTSQWRGLYYMYAFVMSYFLYPFIVVLFFAARNIFRSTNRYLVIFLIELACWGCYIIVTGGDHMEFRFIVPVLPYLIVVVMWILFSYFRRISVRSILVCVIFSGTVYHAMTFAASTDPGIAIAPLRQYAGFFTREDERWTAIGKTLYNAFPDRDDVRIATTAAGAIPYYSKLPTVDMLGINDKWVARHGNIVGTTPGHQRIAPMSYLVGRGVNLLIAHPVIVESTSTIRQIPLAPMDSIVSFRDATFIIIPIDTIHKVVTMYLIKNPVVDKAIIDNHWEVFSARIK